MRRTSLILFTALACAGFSQAAAAEGTLTVYTYESFTADWGRVRRSRRLSRRNATAT